MTCERLSFGKYRTLCAQDTEDLGFLYSAHQFSRTFLDGYLGAGKTTFMKGVARGLGIDQDVLSPTFPLECIYAYTSSTATDSHESLNKKHKQLHHYDLYRIEHEDELEDIGIYETMHAAGIADDDVVFIEWGERFRDALTDEYLLIQFVVSDSRPDERIITMRAQGMHAQACLKRFDKEVTCRFSEHCS